MHRCWNSRFLQGNVLSEAERIGRGCGSGPPTRRHGRQGDVQVENERGHRVGGTRLRGRTRHAQLQPQPGGCGFETGLGAILKYF